MVGRLTEAQNAHDADTFASYFAEDYVSVQPAHPGRAFRGRRQVLSNWTSVFEGVPDFHAELLSSCIQDETEWAEVAWHGRHTDGSAFAMRGVVVVVLRNGLIAEGRLYVEPVDADGDDIEAAVERLYRAPTLPPEERTPDD